MERTRSRGRERSSSGDEPRLDLCLYVAAGSPNSVAARANLNEALESMEDGGVRVTIIDVFEAPERALEDQVYVTPMLIRLAPLPRIRIAGTLRDRAALLQLLAVDESEVGA